MDNEKTASQHRTRWPRASGALLSTVLSALLFFGCTSKESIAASLQDYCDLAEEMIRSGSATAHDGMLDEARIYDAWKERSPSSDVQDVLDSFYSKLYHRGSLGSDEQVEIEDYRRMMTAAANEFGLPSPRCDALMGAFVESNRLGTRLAFVSKTCRIYGRNTASLLNRTYGASEHDKALRDALAEAITDARHVNQNGKAFVEKMLSVEPALRGRTFAGDLVEWRGFEFGPGDPCLDLQLDVDRLYKEHLEKQGIETP